MILMKNLKELNQRIYSLETEKTKLKYEGLEKAKLHLEALKDEMSLMEQA